MNNPLKYHPQLTFIAPYCEENDDEVYQWILKALGLPYDPNLPIEEWGKQSFPLKLSKFNQEIMVNYQSQATQNRSPFGTMYIILMYESSWNEMATSKKCFFSTNDEDESILESICALANVSGSGDQSYFQKLTDKGIQMKDWSNPSQATSDIDQIIQSHIQKIDQLKSSFQGTPTPFSMFSSKTNNTGSYQAADKSELMIYSQMAAFNGFKQERTALALGLYVDQGTKKSFHNSLVGFHNQFKDKHGKPPMQGSVTGNSQAFKDCCLNDKLSDASTVDSFKPDPSDVYLYTQYSMWRSMNFNDMKLALGLYLKQNDFKSFQGQIQQKHKDFVSKSGKEQATISMTSNSKEFAQSSLNNINTKDSIAQDFEASQENIKLFTNYYLANGFDPNKVSTCLGLFLPEAKKKDFASKVEKQYQAWKKNSGRPIDNQKAKQIDQAQRQNLTESLNSGALTQALRTVSSFAVEYHCHLVSLDDFAKKKISQQGGLGLPPSRLNNLYRKTLGVRASFSQALLISHSKMDIVSPINYYKPADITIFFVKVDSGLQKKLKKYKGVLNVIKACNQTRTPFNENLSFVFLVDENSHKYYKIVNSFQSHFSFHTEAINMNLCPAQFQEKVIQLCKTSLYVKESPHGRASMIESIWASQAKKLRQGDTTDIHKKLLSKEVISMPASKFDSISSVVMQQATEQVKTFFEQNQNQDQQCVDNLLPGQYFQQLMQQAQDQPEKLYLTQLIGLLFFNIVNQQLSQVWEINGHNYEQEPSKSQTIQQYFDQVGRFKKTQGNIIGQPPVLCLEGCLALNHGHEQSPLNKHPYSNGGSDYLNALVRGLIFVRTYFGMASDIQKQSVALRDFPFVTNVEALCGELQSMDHVSLAVNEFSLDGDHIQDLVSALKKVLEEESNQHKDLRERVASGSADSQKLAQDSGAKLFASFSPVQVMGLADAIGMTLVKCCGQGSSKNYSASLFFDKVTAEFYAPYLSI